VALGEVRKLDRPVVHLQVDVRRVRRRPRGLDKVVPDALEVERLPAGARAGDHQVARELEEERGESFVASGRVLRDALVGGKGLGGSEVDGHAVEESAVVSDVCCADLIDRLLSHGGDRGLC
jgi:hypothetical protein